MNAPSSGPKRHLRVRVRGARVIHAACGLTNPLRYTYSPELVTCGACRRTLAMADAEIVARRSEKRKQSGN